MTLLRCNVEEPKTSYAKVRSLAKKKEVDKFQQSFCVNYILEELIFLLDVMNSVYGKIINFHYYSTHLYCPIKSHFIGRLFIIFLCSPVRMSWNIGNIRNLFLKLKSKLGLYHFVLTTPKTSPVKLTLSVVEM